MDKGFFVLFVVLCDLGFGYIYKRGAMGFVFVILGHEASGLFLLPDPRGQS